MNKLTKHNRLRIGLIFTGSYDWVGGLYYIHNIIRSLHHLEEERKPFLLIIPEKATPKEFILNFDYPFTEFFYPSQHTLLRKVYNRLYKYFTSHNLYFESIIEKYNLDWIYPFNDFSGQYETINNKKISWIYDFQHKLLPELFSAEELEKRNELFSNITRYARRIVVSSSDSMHHLKHFYPETKSSIKVLHFVSIIDTKSLPDFAGLKAKYKIAEPYFIVSNQFWQHKNHLVVLEALRLLKEENQKINIVFTGRESDHRNPGYFDSLKEFIRDNQLEPMVTFLGFIPREDQLQLMKNSVAVIQPSKFEGWGTVVEDAKTLLKPIIVSDISIHREQLGDKGYYFSPHSPEQLSSLLRQFSMPEFHPALPLDDHAKRMKEFAEDFIKIFDFSDEN